MGKVSYNQSMRVVSNQDEFLGSTDQVGIVTTCFAIVSSGPL